MPVNYRGRFAPSPTGPLHFGSLVTAAGSWLDARRAGGKWLLRIEDIDEARTVPGADALIQTTLEHYGLLWDEEVVWQTRRYALYEEAIERLGEKVFACACSRKEAGGRYPGTCRNGIPPGRAARAVRLRTTDQPVSFFDRRLGWFSEVLSDFILRRADGLYAYQLAVVVDDWEQGITDVVRGADLLDSTARQVFLQRQLEFPTPSYLHLPVATNAAGVKLSKQTLAPPIDPKGNPEVLLQAIQFLGHSPPSELRRGSCGQILEWAVHKRAGAEVNTSTRDEK